MFGIWKHIITARSYIKKDFISRQIFKEAEQAMIGQMYSQIVDQVINKYPDALERREVKGGEEIEYTLRLVFLSEKELKELTEGIEKEAIGKILESMPIPVQPQF